MSKETHLEYYLFLASSIVITAQNAKLCLHRGLVEVQSYRVNVVPSHGPKIEIRNRLLKSKYWSQLTQYRGN